MTDRSDATPPVDKPETASPSVAPAVQQAVDSAPSLPAEIASPPRDDVPAEQPLFETEPNESTAHWRSDS